MIENLRLNSMLGKLNSTLVSSDERENIIYRGRTLVCERIAREKNNALSKAGKPVEDFGYVCKNSSEFEKHCREWTDDVAYFCAKRVNEVMGKTNTHREDVAANSHISYSTDPIYTRMLASIIGEVQYSITPFLISPLVGEMCSVMTVPKGQTKEVAITSNAVFAYEDTTWEAIRSVPEYRLYNNSITLNPRPFATRTSVVWYQMIGNNGNLVDTIAAMAGGYAAYIMKKFTDAFTTAAANTKYVPSALTASGYTGGNWATVVQNVAKANRVRRDQLVAYGDFLALRKILPDDASLASAIMMQLGNEYFKNGYIASKDGVMAYEIQPTSTPETINTSMTSVFPTDTIIIAARATERYAPMLMCFEEGSDVQVNLNAGADVLATGRIELAQVAAMDIAPAFASRIGTITSIS